MAEDDKQQGAAEKTPHPSYKDKCPAPLRSSDSPKASHPSYQNKCPPPLNLSDGDKPVHPSYQDKCPPPLNLSGPPPLRIPDKSSDGRTSPPGLSAQLTGFNKSSLRKTDTVVTMPDGRQVVEGKDDEGRTITKSVSFGSLGFCQGLMEDLQVGEVLPGLIIGSQDVAHNLELLEQYHVTHILNVASHVQNLYPEKFKYLSMDLRDLPEYPIYKDIPKALDFIDEALDSKGCVLVHCNAGISRSATIVLAHLMKTKDMSLNDAFTFLRSKRPSSFPNPGFMIQLKTFEDSLGIESS
ncbi:dual specificity protein phosphatase 19-like [Littorina saxatilis]|uniref:Uncharacterized protein n=1 Tax=Littorina saxatilis TaxID=31220 RepID=A0AAN9BPX3_9CAEN